MNNKSIFTLVFSIFTLCIFCIPNMKAQTEVLDDKAEIEKTLGLYFDRWLTGDTTKIGMAMHTTCHLKNVKDGKIALYDRSTYLGFFKPRPRLANAEGRIMNIDITGPAAAAKIELETEKRIFTDYFNLLKLEDRWYIMDKISTSVQK